jgi:hypothetical protein
MPTDAGGTRASRRAKAATDKTSVVGVPSARAGGTTGTGKGSPPVPGLNGGNRPAWQPMAIPARPAQPRGVTIFGTTLTRRQTVIAGAMLLAVLLLLVLLVPRAFGNDDGGKAAKPPATPAASAPANPAPTATTTAPSPAATSTAPSSAPPTTAARPPAGSVVLPAGWYLYKDGTGFSVPVPKGWRISHRGSEVYFQDNSGDGRLLIVDQTRQPKADPVKDWQTQEASRRSGYRDYRRIGIRAVSYWDKAADWEFTRTSDSGNPLHVVKRGFITAPDQAYGISWSTSAGDWNANKDELALIYKGFVPARS